MDIDELILKFELDGCLQMLHLQKTLEEKGILSVMNSKKARIDVFLQEEDRALENPAFMMINNEKRKITLFIIIRLLSSIKLIAK